MKKLTLLTLLAISAITSFGQLPEDFNTKCIINGASPDGGWRVYNPPNTPPNLEGNWKCTATDGKPNGAASTPGVYCTGFYSGAHHLDTSYLITDVLYLSSTVYTSGHVYLLFDSKKVNNTSTGRMVIVESEDSTFNTPTSIDTIMDSEITPALGALDAANWTTHEIDLSDSINAGPFYYAFRFTSTSSSSLAWYLDNIRLSEHPLSVVSASKAILPISIVGSSTSSKIELSYSASASGTYRVSLYDMMGREVYNGQLEARSGTATYTINGLNLHAGMYCIKMGNENAYGTAKLIIE